MVCNEWGTPQPSEATGQTMVQAYEIYNSASLLEMFESYHEKLESLSFTQHQIINFVENYRSFFNNPRYITFFLFMVSQQFRVAKIFGTVPMFNSLPYDLEAKLYYLEDRRIVKLDVNYSGCSRIIVPFLRE